MILPKNLIKDDSIIGVGATTKDNIQTNVTKQELPTTTTTQQQQKLMLQTRITNNNTPKTTNQN